MTMLSDRPAVTFAAGSVPGAERARLAEAGGGTPEWRDWGPYLSERAWGTVREDYSPDGDAWSFFPHEHARSRVYRWNEDGMAGFSDETQNWCLENSIRRSRNSESSLTFQDRSWWRSVDGARSTAQRQRT